ncbi:hypothetical protein HHK36_028635 [Tetracentron sinense]|uniref:Protein RFT1 homolog n=1 Tax=Tetracentron sinense TaxID=13715 RepID=A0A834YBR5_TETSI|nr:hypothetical protein HHK36_028635 [Tetracentron sinense]
MSKESVRSPAVGDGDRTNLARTFKYLMGQFSVNLVFFTVSTYDLIDFHPTLHISVENLIFGCSRKLSYAVSVEGNPIYFQFVDCETSHGRGLRGNLFAVQFHLFVTCILFLSREGFRRACMRADIRRDGAPVEENAAKLLKVAWMTLPIGLIITFAACIFVFWWQALNFSDPYGQAILINGSGVVLSSAYKL